MIVAHNLLAMNTNRQLGIVTDEKKKSAEKLASGYRINRSADDAAGLEISEKMRWQIRGLNKASGNIQDAASLIQVADGALNETQSILQRMRELSVQAANDTNTELDRDALQSEIDALTLEVDRIAGDTNFNEEIYPLNGKIAVNSANTATATPSAIGGVSTTVSSVTNSGQADTLVLPDNLYEMDMKIRVALGTAWVDGVEYTNGQSTTIPVLGYQSEVNGTTYYAYYVDTASAGVGADVVNNTEMTTQTIDKIPKTTTINQSDTNRFYTTGLSDLKIEAGTGYIYLNSKNSGNGQKVYFYTKKRVFGCTTMSPDDFLRTVNPTVTFLTGVLPGQNTTQTTGTTTNAATDTTKSLWIQMGAQKEQGMFLALVDATAKGIGIVDPTLDVTSFESAGESIVRIDDALSKVSTYRSTFGAQQNRLEHAMAVDDATAENTQFAESRIRDTDMAEEMVTNSKHSILQQAGQSMLAQANQSTQGVLSLLQ